MLTHASIPVNDIIYTGGNSYEHMSHALWLLSADDTRFTLSGFGGFIGFSEKADSS